jgi:hypothetical protein
MINEKFMKKDVIQSLTGIICIFILPLFISVEPAFARQTSKPAGYAGSVSCRECHEKFYTLWSTSHHGLAMQPYTKAFAENNLTPQTEDIPIKNKNYCFDINRGIVIESFKKNKKIYPVKHVMGGEIRLFFPNPHGTWTVAGPAHII